MKKFLVLLLHGILALNFISFAFASNPPLTIATTEYPPYTGQFLVQKGYVNHIVTAAFKQKNIEVRYVFVPWSRALQGLQDGTFDAASYAYYREDRNQKFIHSDLLIKENVFLFGLKNRVPKTWHSLTELADFRLGNTRGYSYSKEFREFMGNTKYQPSIVNTDLQNFQMLMMQRIDLFPMEEFTARHLLNQHFSEEQVNNIQRLSPKVGEFSTHLIISRTNSKAKHILQRFNDGLARLKASGVLSTFEHQFKNGFYKKRKEID